MSNSTQNWTVTNNGTWDILWQKAIAYYWDNEAACDAQGENKLFYIFEQLGVTNIRNEGNGIVSFLTHVPGHPDRQFQIIRVKIKFNNEPAYCGEECGPSYVWQRGFTPNNGWLNLAVDLTIKLPPKDVEQGKQNQVLSDFVALCRYFPFSIPFIHPDDSTSQAQMPVEVDVDPLPSPDACKGREANDDDTVNLPVEAQDRGGSEGLDDDYMWLHFAPRMVSWNWASTNEEKIKNNTSLSHYPVMMKDLNYDMAPEINVVLQYADKLPCENGVYNLNEYSSLLEVDFPSAKAIKEGFSPIALADLISNRANQPFTSC